MEDTNKSNKTLLYVVGGLVVIVLLAAGYVYYTENMMDSTEETTTEGAGEGTAQEIVSERVGGDEDLDGDGVLSAEEIEAQSEDRASNIQSERERLLAEQARLEAQANATSTGTSTEANSAANAERQQQIEIELLELQNAEEYPPLPDPGA